MMSHRDAGQVKSIMRFAVGDFLSQRSRTTHLQSIPVGIPLAGLLEKRLCLQSEAWMSKPVFNGDFTQQEALPHAAIEAAERVLKSGRLHRYNLKEGEAGETSLLEAEYAAWQGAPYCLATASGAQAMQIALRAAGVRPGQPVLTNAFTLAPVPGAVAAVGASPVLVEIDENLRIDMADLVRKAETIGGSTILLSHMRGHVCDMDRLMEIADRHKLKVIEDCAHTMGAAWSGRRSGNFGIAGCFSTQTYKHMNSGEGGFLVTADPDLIARAIILSGSYMLYARHGAGPAAEHFEAAKYEMPNMSARMDALRAAILRPQLQTLDANIQRWNDRYDAVASMLSRSSRIVLPIRPEKESMASSSIQFRVPDFSTDSSHAFIAAAQSRGVELKWFGRSEPHGFTSRHDSWRYMPSQQLPQTDRILSTLFDMRLPLTFTLEDCEIIGKIIVETVEG
jgi:dTDP-4-amino-4,6-dideoxygalactose transaminase